MPGSLSWERDHKADVSTVEELDAVLTSIAEQAEGGRAVAVQLFMNSGIGLCIVVGGDVSLASFYSEHGGPLVVNVCGQLPEEEIGRDDEIVIFSYEGEYSEVLRRECVPVAMAHEAMRLFFVTGQRPDNLMWDE